MRAALLAAFAAAPASPAVQPVAVPQGWQDLASRCLKAMEDAVRFRETGKGRPPEQTCLFEIEELRAMLAAAPAAPAVQLVTGEPKTS